MVEVVKVVVVVVVVLGNWEVRSVENRVKRQESSRFVQCFPAHPQRVPSVNQSVNQSPTEKLATVPGEEANDPDPPRPTPHAPHTIAARS